MTGKLVTSERGTTYYWIERHSNPNAPCIVFTHGLAVNHRLFDCQLPYFTQRYTVITWDIPLHGRSLVHHDFSYGHAAAELRAILRRENISKVVLVGQSTGGLICQEFIARYPECAAAFVAQDTMPLGLEYYSEADQKSLKKTPKTMKRLPYAILCTAMAKQAAATHQGYQNCLKMIQQMDKKHIINAANAVYADLFTRQAPVEFPCPVLLLLGEKDHVGKISEYNRIWAEKTRFPLHLIEKAGHHCNVDNPEEFNRIVERFIIRVLRLI